MFAKSPVLLLATLLLATLLLATLLLATLLLAVAKLFSSDRPSARSTTRRRSHSEDWARLVQQQSERSSSRKTECETPQDTRAEGIVRAVPHTSIRL
jgi:hypothetical protein